MPIEYRAEPEFIEYLDGEAHPILRSCTPPEGFIATEVRSCGDSLPYLQRTIDVCASTGRAHFAQGDTFTNEPFLWLRFEVRELFSVLDPLPDWVE